MQLGFGFFSSVQQCEMYGDHIFYTGISIKLFLYITVLFVCVCVVRFIFTIALESSWGARVLLRTSLVNANNIQPIQVIRPMLSSNVHCGRIKQSCILAVSTF